MKIRLGMIILLAGLTAACGVVSVEFQTPLPATAPLAQATDAPPLTSTIAPPAETPPSATPAPTETPAPPSATPSPVPSPTDTPIPADTPTPTPAYASVTVSENLNVRSGPGTNYARVGLLAAGQTTLIMGRTAASDWWQIDYPDAANGLGWISAAYSEASFTDNVPVVDAPPTPTPAVPTPTPSPTVPPVDFVVKSVRLWSNEENGGWNDHGSVHCGEGHNIYAIVVDAAGQPLNGVIVSDTYGNDPSITGSKGPGIAEFIIYNGNGRELYIKEDQSAGRAVTSEVSPVLSGKFFEIPIPWLVEAHYCADAESCRTRIEQEPMVCFSHFSYDITFQRTW